MAGQNAVQNALLKLCLVGHRGQTMRVNITHTELARKLPGGLDAPVFFVATLDVKKSGYVDVTHTSTTLKNSISLKNACQ